MNTTLWQGDCLELMKDIPDGAVDVYFNIAKKRIEEALLMKGRVSND